MANKRLLDCRASDFRNMTGKELKQSIKASEGRVIVSEVIGAYTPHYPTVSNAELVAAFGTDLLLLNFFDVFNPSFQGIDAEGSDVIERMKELTGRPIGLNLEPVDLQAKSVEELTVIEEGRIASKRSLAEALRLGFDFVCLTGNPKTGVTNEEIVKAIRLARAAFGADGLIIAGKMHGAGVENKAGSGITSKETVIDFIEAGADIILMPSPGTVPGITVDSTQKLVRIAQNHGALVMLTIGTSQEGADTETIRQIALWSKMTGADLFHIGDAGYHGVAIPENILTYSITIRGKRHTYMRMASSILR